MKHFLKLFILVIVAGMCIPVFAMQHITSEIIPFDEVATVDTDTFTYTDFSYSPTVTGKNYGIFRFKSITNKTSKSVPISIDILLFDEKKENIGFVTYCTDADYDGEYSHMKLGGGKSTDFYINVTDRYFVDEMKPTDVRYFAVLDDNQYCHVGGYDKYAGLTIEEISSGTVVIKTDDGETVKWNEDFMRLIGSVTTGVIFITIILVIGGYVIQGLILNALYKRMFANTTALAYLPIANQYIAVKLAFGGMIAKVYLITLFVSAFLFLLGPLKYIYYLLSFAGFAAFVIDIIKLITKKYDLCYLEPFTNNKNVATGGSFNLRVPQKVEEEEKVTPTTPKEENLLDEEKVDLNYDSSASNGGFINPESDNDNFSASDLFGNADDNSNTSSNNRSNENEGDSELANLFK